MKLCLRLKEDNREKWYTRLFISVVLLKATNLAFSSTKIIPDKIEMVLLGFVVLFFSFSIFFIIGKYLKMNFLTLIIGTGFSSLFLYSLAFYPEIYSNIFKRFIWTVVFGMSCFGCMVNICNIRKFLKQIKPYSYILTILGTMIFFCDITKLSSNMTFSGMMLFPFCLHFYYALKRNIIDLIFCLYELFIIFIHGSRGGIFSILLFVFMYYSIKGLKDIKILKKIILIIPVFFIMGFTILTNLSYYSSLMTSNGIYIRNIDFLSKGKFFSYKERYIIQSEYLELICNSFPIRFRIVDLYNNGTHYPHNVFIEILYNYGYLLGGFLLLFLFYSLLQCMIKLRREQYDFLMILLCSGLFPLLTSFTYFEWPLFWGLLGYLISHYKQKYQTDLLEESNENLVCY